MPEIARPISNWKVKICMHIDHAPPHFHIRGPGWNVKISLHTFDKLRGNGDASEIRECVEWAKENRELLWNEWNRLNVPV